MIHLNASQLCFGSTVYVSLSHVLIKANLVDFSKNCIAMCKAYWYIPYHAYRTLIPGN